MHVKAQTLKCLLVLVVTPLTRLLVSLNLLKLMELMASFQLRLIITNQLKKDFMSITRPLRIVLKFLCFFIMFQVELAWISCHLPFLGFLKSVKISTVSKRLQAA